MKIRFAIILLFCFVTGAYSGVAQSVITIRSLLKEMTDPESVARYPEPAFLMQQASSYDRKSVSPEQPGWFANADFNQFIREEKKEDHSEFVMMDVDGPGVIVRFWLTTLAKQGTMRFYFNNEEKASLEIPAFDLMKAGLNAGDPLLIPHSSYEPEGKGGNTLYLPLPYQKHCKITWQFADSANMKTPHYYQINYRLYRPDVKVETFSKSLLSQYKGAIDSAIAILRDPPPVKGKETRKQMKLEPGKTLSMFLPEGSSALRLLEMAVTNVRPEDREKMWRSVILKIQFDGQTTVDCPLGDFIGSGYGGKPISSWYRELTESGKLTSRWVMPYEKWASIDIENQSDFAVDLDVRATVKPFSWDRRSMYFHATYRFQQNVRDAKWDYDLRKVARKDTTAPIDWNFVAITGKGVYMGNTLSVDNHMKSWYGEGDAKAYVDNEKFPSEFGTGLEDYYNTSWAPVVLYQTPFANAPRADQPSSQGYNTFTRTRNLDVIPFTTKFYFDMEMLSWDGGTIDAAATTYWYGIGEAWDMIIPKR